MRVLQCIPHFNHLSRSPTHRYNYTEYFPLKFAQNKIYYTQKQND